MGLADLRTLVRDTAATVLPFTVHRHLPATPVPDMAYVDRISVVDTLTLSKRRCEVALVIVAKGLPDTAIDHLEDWTDALAFAFVPVGVEFRSATPGWWTPTGDEQDASYPSMTLDLYGYA